MIQLELFDAQIIKHARLVAESPKRAFYKIWLESYLGKYRVCKESGVKGKVLDRRSWEFDSLEKAEKEFTRRIKEKTNPGRRSPRKYKMCLK